MPYKTGRWRGLLLALGLMLPAPALRAQIVAHIDENGQRIFVNSEDVEMRDTVRRGGRAAGKQLLEERRRKLAAVESHIDTEARTHGVDASLVRAIIEVESAWNPYARSRKGALGLMQLLPETGRRHGARDLMDPAQNVSGGIRYLRSLLDEFGDTRLALAAYNAGENAVKSYDGVPPFRETRTYLARIEALYGGLGGGRIGKIYRSVDANGRAVYEN